jgi:glycosyltransferase involved in cell wall biosynthesis
MIFKSLFGARVIYDAHELETERWGAGIKKTLSKLLERLLVRRADRIIVVSNSIAEWYEKRYGLRNVAVVRNVPYRQSRSFDSRKLLRKKFHLHDDDMLFIYQGALGNGRGIEVLLNVFSRVDRGKHIVFMGYGSFEETVKKYDTSFPNIHFCPAVEPDKVMEYAKGADVGICLIENESLSYFFSLPNKLFEYIGSGLPVIVSNFPEMGGIVDETRCGWKVPVNEDALVRLVGDMSMKEIGQKKDRALQCRDRFCWQKEEEELLAAYSGLGEHRGG